MPYHSKPTQNNVTDNPMNVSDYRHLDRIALKRANSYHIQGISSSRNDLPSDRSRSHSRGVSCHGFPRAQRSVSSKNIAMRVDATMNDWNNFTINQAKKPGQKLPAQEHPKSSLSSYSKVHDGSNSMSHLSHTTLARGHLREVRSHSRESRTSHLHQDSHSKTNLDAKSYLSLENGIHSGKTQIVKSGDCTSMSPTAPVATSDSDTESEAEMHDESKLPFLEPSEDYEDYESVQNMGPDFENITSILDFMKGVDKPKNDLHIFRSTRTQQKLDDMKSLLGDPDAESAKMGMVDYAVRIQNEAISSQWSQIRLRFSNYLHQDVNQKSSEQNGKGKSNHIGASIECHAGILGSVKRLQGIETRPSHSPLISKDHAQEYLVELWNCGLSPESPSKSSSYQGLAIPGSRHVSIVAGSDGDIYQNHEKFNVSMLARNVMSSRDEETVHEEMPQS